MGLAHSGIIRLRVFPTSSKDGKPVRTVDRTVPPPEDPATGGARWDRDLLRRVYRQRQGTPYRDGQDAAEGQVRVRLSG